MVKAAAQVQASTQRVATFVLCGLIFCISAVHAELLDDGTWEVRAGENLNFIANTFFPNQPEQRLRFRQAVIHLNPEIFHDVEHPYFIRPGERLRLPAFALDKQETDTSEEPIDSVVVPREAQSQTQQGTKPSSDVDTAQELLPEFGVQGQTVEKRRPFFMRGEWSGNISPQIQVFFEDAQGEPDYTTNLSIAAEPEYYLEWDDGKQSVTFVPFGRLDQEDSRRTHFDIRELNWLNIAGNWEWRVGVGKVFWGVTEFIHLVDIINQTDAVENIDDEDKLGQPMVQATWLQDWGSLQLFVLPYFRERTFPGKGSRLRTRLVVDIDQAEYQSGAREYHVDVAARVNGTLGALDYGVSQFIGTGRDPELRVGTKPTGTPVLIPRYVQILQTGLELQAIVGDWLWKLEAIYRHDPNEDFFASIGGFERTLVGVFETAIDVGLLAEYSYDGRDDRLNAPFQNDLFLGFRMTFNDVQSTQILAGGSIDVENGANTVRVEASRRIGENWKLNLELQSFSNVGEKDPLFDLENDDFVQIDLGYFF